MALRRFVPGRAVEVIGNEYGSGYRISGSLVLTAAHVSGTVGSNCTVRDKHFSNEAMGKVVWQSQDIALIELHVAAGVKAIALGQLPQTTGGEKIAFQMYAYPSWAWTRREQGSAAGGRQIEGTIYLQDRSPDRLLVLRLPSAVSITDGSTWKGASGAAIICDGLVIAVLCQDPSHSHAVSLEAVPLQAIAGDKQWQQLLRNHGVDPALQTANISFFERAFRKKLPQLMLMQLLLWAVISGLLYWQRESGLVHLIDLKTFDFMMKARPYIHEDEVSKDIVLFEISKDDIQSDKNRVGESLSSAKLLELIKKFQEEKPRSLSILLFRGDLTTDPGLGNIAEFIRNSDNIFSVYGSSTHESTSRNPIDGLKCDRLRLLEYYSDDDYIIRRHIVAETEAKQLEEYKKKLASVECNHPQNREEMYESIMFSVANDYLKSEQKPLLCAKNISTKADKYGACPIDSVTNDDEVINFRITKNTEKAFTQINLSVDEIISGKELKDTNGEQVSLEGKILLIGDSRGLFIGDGREGKVAATYNGRFSYLQVSAHAINGMIQNSMTGRNLIRSNNYYDIACFLLLELVCFRVFIVFVRGKVLQALLFLIPLLLCSFLLCCVMLVYGLWVTILSRAIVASLSAVVIALLATPILPSNVLPQDK